MDSEKSKKRKYMMDGGSIEAVTPGGNEILSASDGNALALEQKTCENWVYDEGFIKQFTKYH